MGSPPHGPDGGAVLRLTTAMPDLARLYDWLEAAAAGRIEAALLGRMQVVLEEVATNVARHAYSPGETGPLEVALRVGAEAAVLEVRDTGVPFDPTQAVPQAPGAERVGGWGLGLVRRYCAGMAYAREDGGNRLTLRFAPG